MNTTLLLYCDFVYFIDITDLTVTLKSVCLDIAAQSAR